MARYDANWDRYPRGQGGQRAFSRGPASPGNFPGAGRGYGGYDGLIRPGDYGIRQGHNGFAEQEQGRAGIYGPERYGLGPYHQRLRTRRRPDDELKREVEEALFYDTWVDSEAVQVQVKDGIVTLRGELPDYDEIRYATDDVWDVDGVLGVRSELRVGREQ